MPVEPPYPSAPKRAEPDPRRRDRLYRWCVVSLMVWCTAEAVYAILTHHTANLIIFGAIAVALGSRTPLLFVNRRGRSDGATDTTP